MNPIAQKRIRKIPGVTGDFFDQNIIEVSGGDIYYNISPYWIESTLCLAASPNRPLGGWLPKKIGRYPAC
jgi:hypothetical protein